MEISKQIIDKIKVLDELPNSQRFHQDTGANSKISRKMLDGNVVALKKIQPEYKNTVEKRAQIFLREVTDHILAQYPSVLPVCGFNLFHYSKSTKSFIYKPCLATVFCDGGMLSNVLKKMSKNKKLTKRFIQTQQYIFAYGIAKGMKKLYMNHILHRDLKNDNIFISKPKCQSENIPEDIIPLFKNNSQYSIPFIADLGLAKVAQNSEQSQQCGTFYYLAPEVMSSTKYSFPADVYSYSVILSNIFQLKDKPDFDCKKTSLFFIQYVTKGGRPDVSGCTEIQKEYLSKLWDFNQQLRPTFIDIVDYLENPTKDNFIFNDYEEDVIEAYKKFIDFQISSDSNPESKNENKYDIFKKYDQYERTQEEFYRLEPEDAKSLSNLPNDTQFENCITSSIIRDSGIPFNCKDQNEKVQINEYVSSFISNYSNNQSPVSNTPESYLQNAILSESKKDYESAKQFYLKAFKSGSISAATRLSILMLKHGDIETKKNGFDLLKFAAEKKEKDGLYYYGYILTEGFEPKGIKADKEKAAKLLEEAGELGNCYGFFEAASIHHEFAIKESKEGNEENANKHLSKAIQLYKFSYEKYGDEESQKLSIELQSYLDKK